MSEAPAPSGQAPFWLRDAFLVPFLFTYMGLLFGLPIAFLIDWVRRDGVGVTDTELVLVGTMIVQTVLLRLIFRDIMRRRGVPAPKPFRLRSMTIVHGLYILAAFTS